MTEVRKTLEYMGFRTITDNGGNVYDILSASKEQEEMLDRFFDEGVSNIASAGKEFSRIIQGYATDMANYTVEFIASVKDEYEVFISQDIVSYLVHYIIAQWLLLGNIAADKVQIYFTIAQNFLRSYKTWIGSNGRGDGAESKGGNEIGDTVDSFVVEDEDSAETDEAEGCNQIGDDLPQQFGARNIVRTRLCRHQ